MFFFNGAVSSSEYVVTVDRIINDLERILKETVMG
jgi:hypothetical protein